MFTLFLQRLLLFLLCLLVVAFFLGPMLLGGPKALSHFYQTTIYLDAPQTKYTISASYSELAQADAVEAGIPPNLFVRQINQESGFDPNAASPAGAEGIAQFMPGTAAGLGINPWDPVQSLRGAAQLMARYYYHYGDYRKALAAYNGGTGNLAVAMQNCGENWLACEPAETQRYVHIIMNE